jgi:hypothetical protein
MNDAITQGFALNTSTGGIRAFDEGCPLLIGETSYPDYASALAAAPSLPAHIPQSVSRFQALAALSNAGLLTQAQAAVNAAGGLTLLAWDNAQSFDRTSPTIAALAGPLNLTSAQVDNLFIAAAKIQA